MARFLSHVVASTMGIALLMPVSFAQSAPGTPSPAPDSVSGVAPATSPVLAPTPAEKAPPPAPAAKRPRAISSEVAAALAAAGPKYTPPPPKPEPQPERELVDLREIDKPRNTIIRLPAVVVQEARPAVFSERAVHTEKGLADIAMRRYISDADRALNRFTLPLFGTSMQARAMAMYAEDERLKNMADLEDAANTASQSDAAAGTYIRREAQRTYLRSSEFGWSSGEPK